MEQFFKVIYKGKLQAGVDRQAVIEAFAARFKLPVAKAEKIIDAGREVVLKPKSEHVKAYKLKSLLEDLGMEMRLERLLMQVKQSAEPQPEVETKPEKSPDSETATSAPESTEAPPVKRSVSSHDWALEPIQSEKSEVDDEAPEVPGPDLNPGYTDLTKPAVKYEKVTSEVEEGVDQEPQEAEKAEERDSAVWDFIKQFGGIIVAGLAAVFFLAKKFGLLKFLKIGGLMAAAAYAGYNPEEACMGNGLCEEAIEDQIDDCWKNSGLEQYDWDNIDEGAYWALKPQIEEKFIACFRYEGTGERVLESPIDLRFDLIDMCDTLEPKVSACEAKAEAQIKSCYGLSGIGEHMKANDYNYFVTVITQLDVVKEFYGCFLDEDGSQLFDSIVSQMNEEALEGYLDY